ncbi:hypothetical protein JCM5350_003636 [Sporobolomyces pararoseus]
MEGSGKCMVCGKVTDKRCTPCAAAGLKWHWYCSAEHQKKVWYAHKRVCGKRGNPFKFPGLSEREIDRWMERSVIEYKTSSGAKTTWLKNFSSREGWTGSVEERKLRLRDLLEGIKDNGEDFVRDPIQEEALLKLRQVAFETKSFQDPYEATRKSVEERQANARLEIFNGIAAFEQLLYPEITARGPSYPFWTEMQHHQLDAQLLPTLPESAAKQLYFLAALFGLCGLLILISQAIRLSKGIVWFYRWQPEYSIIRPHATLSWSSLAIVVVALFEAFIARTIQLAKGDSKADYGYWFLLVWGSAWVAGAVATWSLAASYIVHLHTSGSRRAPPKLVSIACNVLGICAPLVYLAILLPLGIKAGQRYAAGQSVAVKIKRALFVSAQNWIPGTPFSVAQLDECLPLLQRLVDEINELVYWWKGVFMFYAVTAIVVLLPISTISIVYLTSLRRSIKKTSKDLHQNSLATNGPSRSQKQIQHTWIALVLITTAFSLLATIFFIISIYAFLKPTSLRRNDTFQGLIFSPLYAFGFLGLPCAITLLLRAVEARSSDKKLLAKDRKRRSAGGVGGDDEIEGGGGSSCWGSLWSGSWSRSTPSCVGGGDTRNEIGGVEEGERRVKGGDQDLTTTIGQHQKGGKMSERKESSVLVSFGELLKGGGKLKGSSSRSSSGSKGGGNEKRKPRSREISGGAIGSNVMVDVQIEVREENGDDDFDEEKEMRGTPMREVEKDGREKRFERV